MRSEKDIEKAIGDLTKLIEDTHKEMKTENSMEIIRGLSEKGRLYTVEKETLMWVLNK